MVGVRQRWALAEVGLSRLSGFLKKQFSVEITARAQEESAGGLGDAIAEAIEVIGVPGVTTVLGYFIGSRFQAGVMGLIAGLIFGFTAMAIRLYYRWKAMERVSEDAVVAFRARRKQSVSPGDQESGIGDILAGDFELSDETRADADLMRDGRESSESRGRNE